MIEPVKQTIRRFNMLAPGDRVVAGVSGGADSVAMLHMLFDLRKEFDIEIFAAHVNHCLRGQESDADEALVRELCIKLGVSFDVIRADVEKEAKEKNISVEEAGRQCRYAFFNEAGTLRGAGKIAVAHNMDDSAETVLLNLARGTGLKGLCGIPPVRYANEGRAKPAGALIIRPLIEQPRRAIEAYLSQNKIPYRNDITNFQNDYARNRVRNNILPAFRAGVNKNATANIARGAGMLRAEEEFMAEAARAAYMDCAIFGKRENGTGRQDCLRLNISKLSAVHPAIARRVFRVAYEEAANTVKDLSIAHMNITADIAGGASGREAKLPAGITVRREYNELVFFPEKTRAGLKEETWFFVLEPDMPVCVPALKKTVVATLDKIVPDACMKAFRCDTVSGGIPNGLTLRARLPGDRITFKNAGTKKLQDYFTDMKIPRSERDKIPLLAVGSEIVWIMDEHGRTNERYAPKENENKFYVQVKEMKNT